MSDDNRRVPEPTVTRLPVYLQALKELEADGVGVVSSDGLGAKVGASAAQFRKDVSYLGLPGRPGVGYDVGSLIERISGVLGLSGDCPMILAGAGRLGAALSSYPGFAEQGFRIAAVFDSDQAKIGRPLGSLMVQDIQSLGHVNQGLGCRMGVIAVPAGAAQGVADAMVDSGVRWILNFAPARVSAPSETVVRQVDLTHQLEMLSYYKTLAEHGTSTEA